MAFVKVKEKNGIEEIINTDMIFKIVCVEDIYNVIFANDTNSLYTKEEIQKIFQAIGASLD